MTDMKHKIFKRITKVFVYAFACFGVLFVLILLAVMMLMGPRSKLTSVPKSAVLRLDLNANYTEMRQDDLISELTGVSAYSIFDLVRAINYAATDNRIKALRANLNQTPLSLAQIQDISAALAYFKSQGKKTYLFSSGFGSFGQGSKEYALATYFDQIWMQPHTDIGLTGVNIEVPFFKNILQKIGVTPEFYTRYEYKTAVASFLDQGFTPAYKEELTRLGGGLFEELTNTMALNRNIPVESIKAFIDQAPLFADFAFKNKLIDEIGYSYELDEKIKQVHNASFYDMQDYMAHITEKDDTHLPQVAFLVLEGVIESGLSTDSPLNEAVIGSETVLAQIEELKKIPNLKAVVLRINSPGGSYAASDEIRAALVRLKDEKNIPLVVSMSTYAASGGYFIALAGDYIFADSATITGSIGVLGGKVVAQELMRKLDINWGEIKFGKNAGILSINHKFSQTEKEVFEKSLDEIYQDFTSKVSQARKIDEVEIDKIARGRIWLGQKALEIKLVDELDGLQQAILKAKDLAGIKQDEEFALSYYPRRETLQEKLSKFIENGGGLPMMKVFSGLEDLRIFMRLKENAVLPPMVIKM